MEQEQYNGYWGVFSLNPERTPQVRDMETGQEWDTIEAWERDRHGRAANVYVEPDERVRTLLRGAAMARVKHRAELNINQTREDD